MSDRMEIGEVARRTGLSLRALRRYEQCGIVAPGRTAGQRRVYRADDLARLNAATALKRLGFPLKDVAAMLARGPLDLGPLIAARIATLEVQAAELATSRALLLSVRGRIDRGEPIDIVTLCALIRTGEAPVDAADMATIAARYLDVKDRENFAASWAALPAGFDQPAYAQAWRDLGARIEAALPLDPRSTEAQGFVDAWMTLLRPFARAASPQVFAGVARMYDEMDQWGDAVDPGFSKQVWDFIKLAAAARMTGEVK